MTSARRLLSAAPAFRQLFVATLASGAGTWLAVVALTVDVYDRTRSGRWVSALLIADFLPMIVIGLALGPLFDRLPRRTLLIGADLARLAVFCALPFADSAGAIVGLAAVAGVATAFFRPTVYAGLPNLVDEGDLPAANSRFQTAERLTVTPGPAHRRPCGRGFRADARLRDQRGQLRGLGRTAHTDPGGAAAAGAGRVARALA